MKIKCLASLYVRNKKKEHLKDNTSSGVIFCPFLMECASWDFPLGQVIKVTYVPPYESPKTIHVRVTDRGPGKEPREDGVRVDLCKYAFSLLADLGLGRIPIEAELWDGVYDEAPDEHP
jgi:rare lipoprotein A (peptidoglycan hydrolase)